IISDINFYDKLNGIVSTYGTGVYLTRDGGTSWKPILAVQFCVNIAFNGSPNIILALSVGSFGSPGSLNTSIDGGGNWKPTQPGGFTESFTIASDKTIYVLSSADPTNGLPGFTSYSTDMGQSWQNHPAEIDGDSFTMCADSCDSQKLYVANEDYINTVNNLSELYFSTNTGNSWTSAVSFTVQYFTGGMTCTANTIYASSLHEGLYRSTDQGRTWKNIGGPLSMAYDARNIACINDNHIFLIDADGSIWETTNSGGDPLSGTGVNDIILSQNALFSTDTLFLCDQSILKFFNLKPIGCAPPTVTKIDVTGADALSYTTIPLAGDSIGVKFFPLFDSLNADTLVLSLSDGTQKIISLAGFGIPRTPLVLSTQDQASDTLGGAVSIPITLNGLQKSEDISLIVHYDTVLSYKGSFSASGAQLDVPGEQWKGRSKLKIIGATPNATLGFARFDIFDDSVPIQHVTFDSVTVLSAINICQYISPALATSTITPLSGCGVTTVSRFLHYGRMPDLSIMPNPTSGGASITSTMDLGEVNVTIYDMLGTERGRTTMTLGKNSPAKLTLPLSNGVYDVRVNSIAGSCDLRIVVSK
ncbi:MAG: T9SS type A sorting domain-containing protein, partial [Candidatus Kapaibacterium sp.]